MGGRSKGDIFPGTQAVPTGTGPRATANGAGRAGEGKRGRSPWQGPWLLEECVNAQGSLSHGKRRVPGLGSHVGRKGVLVTLSVPTGWWEPQEISRAMLCITVVFKSFPPGASGCLNRLSV